MDWIECTKLKKLTHEKNKQDDVVGGGAGYIGAHMVRRLVDARCDVVILDNLTTGNGKLVQAGVFVQGNLGDERLLDRLFTTHAFDAVMHFVAFSQVGESMYRPPKYYRNNLAETVALKAEKLANCTIRKPI